MVELYGRWPTQGEFIARLVSEYNVSVEAVVLDYFAAARPGYCDVSMKKATKLVTQLRRRQMIGS